VLQQFGGQLIDGFESVECSDGQESLEAGDDYVRESEGLSLAGAFVVGG